jgi:SAM-dependent MidA family methyltransferase
VRAPQKSFFITLDEFVKEFYADGTAARWKRQREIATVEKNRRKLNRKIREEKVILDCLEAQEKERMKLETMEKLAETMKDIAPAIEKAGFVIIDVTDDSNPSWEYVNIRILPRPAPGSTEEKILNGEGF